VNRASLLSGAAALAIAYACDGGQLDAFTSQVPNGDGAGLGGTGGVLPTGGSSGISPAGGEGGDGFRDSLLIDDFEDGDREASLNDGLWYVSNDGTGVQTLSVVASPVENPGSSYSLRSSGVGFVHFGQVICDIAGNASSFDASGYAALSFSARAEPGSSQDVLFAFLVGSQHFAVPVRFATEWGVHTIPFADVLPAEDGPLTSFDPRAIAAILFVVPRGASFDFWLDDLEFVK
jgi:hypothetical protein